MNLDLLKVKLADWEKDLPTIFPEDDYRKTVVRYGRKKLVDTLVEEARLRYQAEMELSANGFRLNSRGKWAVS